MMGTGAAAPPEEITAEAAYEPSPDCVPTISEGTVDERTQAISDKLVELSDAGLSPGEVEREVADAACLTVLISGADETGDELVTPMSNNDDINMPVPTIYYDTAAKYYYVSGTWKWKKIVDKPTLCVNPCNVGGKDGFGATVNGNINVLSEVVQYRGNTYYGWVSSTAAEHAGSSGVFFKFQDKIRLRGGGLSDALNTWEGKIVMAFRPKSGCENVVARTKFAHTWSSTGISGVSIGNSGISVSFSSSGSNWQRYSQPSRETRVCR